MKFVVWCPMAYDESSGGIIALHKLAHNIASLGEDAYITTGNKREGYSGKQITADEATEILQQSDAVVIYPEVVKGNPLNAKKIVRWLLNTPDVIAYSFGEGNRDCDMFVRYASKFGQGNVKGKDGGELRAVENNFDIFSKRNYGNRTASAHIIKKGKDKGWHSSDSVCIDEFQGNKYLSDLFNQCSVFISYDTACWHSIQAALCGCVSIVVPDKSIPKAEWLTGFPYFSKGIAYGLDDIQRALATVPELPFVLQEIEKATIEQTKTFIENCKQL